MTIIDYDDHFPKDYFNEPASEDGAWITYNSSLGSAGFFYVSYCSPVKGEDIDYGEAEYRTVSKSGQSFVLLDDNWKDLTNSDIKKALNIDFEPNNCCIKVLFAK